MGVLESMTSWVEEAPPQSQSNQRFGNLAFRDYSKIVNEACFDHTRSPSNSDLEATSFDHFLS